MLSRTITQVSLFNRLCWLFSHSRRVLVYSHWMNITMNGRLFLIIIMILLVSPNGQFFYRSKLVIITPFQIVEIPSKSFSFSWFKLDHLDGSNGIQWLSPWRLFGYAYWLISWFGWSQLLVIPSVYRIVWWELHSLLQEIVFLMHWAVFSSFDRVSIRYLMELLGNIIRLGLVDMGVSNTFGSNVFDLLVGLAFPWFLKALISGEAVHINSNGLKYDTILLLGIVAVTVREHNKIWLNCNAVVI